MSYIAEACRRVVKRLVSGYRPWIILGVLITFAAVVGLMCRHRGVDGLELRDPSAYAQLRQRGIVPFDSLCVRVWLWPALVGCLTLIVASTVAEALVLRRHTRNGNQ